MGQQYPTVQQVRPVINSFNSDFTSNLPQVTKPRNDDLEVIDLDAEDGQRRDVKPTTWHG